MAIVLYRIDERLIHGQVVVGWGTRLRPDAFVVVDDELARSAWEQELYLLGLPEPMTAQFVDVETARVRLPEWRRRAERIILLVRDLATMRRLAAGGLMRGQDVNLGGIHHAPGRVSVLPYVYLSEQERLELEMLAGEGVRITARDLPDAREVDLPVLLRRDRERA